jgi:hypothetical protein
MFFIAIEATSFTLNVAVEQLPGLHGVVSNFKSVRTDMPLARTNVRFTPKADICGASSNVVLGQWRTSAQNLLVPDAGHFK